MKSGEELQQQLYSAIMTRQKDGDGDVLTLANHNTEVQVDPEPLLSCLRASGLPVTNIKTVRAKLNGISETQWDSLYVQAGQGSDTELEVTDSSYSGASFSPRISEMLQSSRLTKFR